MKRKQKGKPTDSELEILQVLWAHGPDTVRNVNEAISKRHKVGYTTTLKLMQIMVEKGLLERQTDSRVHIYKASIGESETREMLLDRIVETAFGGSAMKLVMQALGNHKASSEELQEIKALINKIENNKL